MLLILLCTTHLRESNVFSFFNQNWWCKEEDREPAHPTTGHSNSLGKMDMSMILLVAFWLPGYVSQTDGDHQRHIAFVALTMLVAVRAREREGTKPAWPDHER